MQGDDISLKWWPAGHHKCVYRDRRVHLTWHQADVLGALLMNRGKVLSLNDLIEIVYPDPDREPDSAKGCVSQFVCDLRKKLPGLIKTEWGQGFYIDLPGRPYAVAA